MPEPTKLYVPIAGSWSRRRDNPGAWYKTDSPFDVTLRNLGYDRVPEPEDDDGFWSGDLNGLFVQKFFGKSKDDWISGGHALSNYIVDRQDILNQREVVLIAHSHGGQVAAFALKRLLHETPNGSRYLRSLRVVTVDMPVRSGRFLGLIPRGMGKTYRAALIAVAGRWTHLYDGLWNKTRVAGSHAGPRKLEGACRNIPIPGGHSAILRHPVPQDLWQGYLDPCP